MSKNIFIISAVVVLSVQAFAFSGETNAYGSESASLSIETWENAYGSGTRGTANKELIYAAKEDALIFLATGKTDSLLLKDAMNEFRAFAKNQNMTDEEIAFVIANSMN